MILTGNSAAVSTEVTPPLEKHDKGFPPKPIDVSLSASFERYLPSAVSRMRW
jgi:hypothetical protein